MADAIAPPDDAAYPAQTILVLDADEAVRTSLCRTLRESGYAAVPARDPAEAQWCTVHASTRPALVLVDATRPVDDAWHFGASLAGLRPYVPVIAMADFAREEGLRRGLIDPKTPFLRKPVCPSILVRTVGSVLSSWRAQPLA
ncbi:MAG TPA: response regulator [Gemmatimonadales bacterium]